ncbi:BPTD_3080 family restriction endonuclease [Phenylobacterium sp.]|uniref:BPTD_3080 family restriction endonuclease n=1 Tax=Phenylobacterium sp. TaxID=1871053 RepID=UPI000C95DE4F|nr:DEAD/DEAH box helicase family protein [Phenylobacterium sp.]MAK80408.1 restriction endonuclease [Phenylobacterium sp.]
MSKAFFEHPILNSPYEEPTRHHALDSNGQPTNLPPQNGRRKSELISPVPAARNRGRRAREADLFGEQDEADLAYTLTIINEIRSHVASWRQLKNPADWGVTPVTQRLLTYWRKHDFATVRPFFCQVEAVETAIWLTEVAPKQRQYGRYWEHIRAANLAANPELIRMALKLATGAGKTTVMAMLIAWQTLNAVRSGDASKFSRAFLIVTPGITIRDRLGVLLPSHPENYYATRELVPADMVADMGRAKVVLTNYHAFKRRETMSLSKTGRGLLEGRDGPIQTIETEGAMLKRACGELLGFKNVIAINDEAHHCYRERQEDAETPIAAEEKEEAKRNAEAARLWISGLEALKRKIGVRTVFDLSATPFFLRGSGYREGTLFPWTVSDFSLMDAIECGIVKLPRIPVSDNSVTGEAPIYRELWEHIGKRMPKKGAGKSGDLDPLAATFPAELQTALYALYSHYEKTDEEWRRAGIDVPPVFIVVCNNTATSKLVYEWIAGFEREDEDGEMRFRHAGHLDLFRNYDEHGNRLTRFNTLLVDSEALESGEALDSSFRGMMGAEIEQFKRELIEKSGDVQRADNLSDSDLLREAMNTVGRKGRLGEQIRCVVSVSMLTEGWDANTVTHIMGVRAFGTQLLCEQVVGRGLRRQSYELNKDGLFDVEYADILGIPFNFAAEPVVAPVKPPAKTTRVQALRERAELEITFPRVEGYRYDLPDERITAVFTPDSRFELNPGNVGPSRVQNEGIVGEGVELSPQILEDMRPSSISYHLAKRLLFTRFRDPGEDPPMHLFGDLQKICRRWITEGHLVTKGVPTGAILYTELADRAAELIFFACQRGVQGEKNVKAIVDAYNPTGSTRFVAFNTSKDVYTTAPDRSHVSHVVLDSDWEAELARVLERHPRVRAYVKNQGMSFDVPYRDGAVPRKYVPDFIVQLDDGREDALNLILETKGY